MFPDNLNVCLLPMNIIWGKTEENLRNLENYFRLLPERVDLVVLPETFSTGFPSFKNTKYVRLLAAANHNLIHKIKALANTYNVAIAGSYIAESDDKLFNRGFFIESTGKEYYADKKHLFSLAEEDKIFCPGEERMNIEFRGWHISMVICYDLRFPAWCRNVGNQYDLLLVIANWPQVRIDAWTKLLAARAIENEAYVAGVNCLGLDDNNITYEGSSQIFDFKGKEIGQGSGSTPFLLATLNHSKLDAFREKFPAWKDADIFRLL